jgi:hypothetical protein
MDNLEICPCGKSNACYTQQVNESIKNRMCYGCGFLSNSLMKEGEPFYEQQFELLKGIQETFNEVQKVIRDVRLLRTQLNGYIKQLGKKCPQELKLMSDTLINKLNSIEENCYQTKAKSSQDVLNYPIRLNDKLGGLFDVVNSGINAPSNQSREVYAELKRQAEQQLERFNIIKKNDLIQFNEFIRTNRLPTIVVD